MKIGLIGWGVETQSAFRYFGNSHTYIIVNEEPRDDFPYADNVEVFALQKERSAGLVGNVDDLSYLDNVLGCDLIIYQPSAHKNLEKHFAEENDFWTHAKTIQHVFFENCPRSQIIGVTGTKGKGTTTTLIAKILENSGKTVHVGGNIGFPVLDLLANIKENDWVVLELSSFQLYKFPYSPHVAVHLMMMHEHIEEWHKTMDDYVEAKRNILSHQLSDDIAVYLPSNYYSAENVKYSAGKHIPYTEAPGAFIDSDGYITIDGVKIIHSKEVGLIGNHNLENICAAITATWSLIENKDSVANTLRDFKGLEHRIEFVRELNGVKYYDDSFGTTPDTAIVAMNAFDNPKIVIVGGHDKGSPFDTLAKRLTEKDVKHVIFIGSTGQKILNLALKFGLSRESYTIKQDGNTWTMQEIIQEAQNHTNSGDIVLLSTGCASFGLFKDYKDRGNQFKKTVNELRV